MAWALENAGDDLGEQYMRTFMALEESREVSGTTTRRSEETQRMFLDRRLGQSAQGAGPTPSGALATTTAGTTTLQQPQQSAAKAAVINQVVIEQNNHQRESIIVFKQAAT